MELTPLSSEEVVMCQRRGYFDEHLASLYSTAYGEPYLYKNKYLVYHDPASKTASITLFELDSESPSKREKLSCFKELTAHFKPTKLFATSPFRLPSALGNYACGRVYEDRDYQISLDHFDETLKGGEYKSLRYHVNHARRCGYSFEVGKCLTTAHINIMAEFLTRSKDYELWDYQLYLGLSSYISKFDSPRLFNLYLDDLLIGFDVVDFLSDVMVVPLGFYLDYPSIADDFIYEEILHAKRQHFQWLDVGWACNIKGLQEFKTKWKAVPRFHVCMQVFQRV